MFVFDKLSIDADWGFRETHTILSIVRDLCVRWSFLGGVVLEEGSFDYFLRGSINHWLTTRLLISRISLLVKVQSRIGVG